MEDVEILESANNWDLGIPVLAEVVENEIIVQQIIVGNEIQNVMGKAHALVCPECKRILQQFPSGVSDVEIAHALCTDNEAKLKGIVYCSGCGRGVRIFRPMPIDGQYEVTTVEESAE